MKTFFSLDQPRSVLKYFGIGEPGTIEQPFASVPSRVWPWSPSLVSIPEPDDFPYWRAGPKSDNHLASQAHRLERILKSIQEHGYAIRQSDLPSYLLLINDCGGASDEFRAVLTHGNHRLAVLAHLGWNWIPMAPAATLTRNEIR